MFHKRKISRDIVHMVEHIQNARQMLKARKTNGIDFTLALAESLGLAAIEREMERSRKDDKNNNGNSSSRNNGVQ